MKSSLRFLFLFALVAGLVTATGSVPARSDTPAASELVRVVVTALGRHGNPAPVVTGGDLLVFQDSRRRPVVDWQPAAAEEAQLDLVLFFDDALDTGVGLQLDHVAAFIHSLPATTRVAVAYGRNGVATLAQDFTSDHALAVRALRLPLGTQGASSSPYLSLIDLLDRLPRDSHRREVLMVSDGVDLFRGLEDSSPPSNPDLRRAIERAQRRGVVVDTIYARGESALHRNFILISNGQSSLARLALETGGQAFFQGFDTPVAFQPFLRELAANLGQQYVLTFRALPGKKAGYQRFQITTEVPGVELVAPAQVYIPAAK